VSLSAVKAYDKETLTIDNQEVFSTIFAENHAEIISSGHIWTEGPAFSEIHETLYFSDVPKGHIWAYKNGEAKLIITNSGDKITMPGHT
jgi:gluconolactonase